VRVFFAAACLALFSCELIGGIEVRTHGDVTTSASGGQGQGQGAAQGSGGSGGSEGGAGGGPDDCAGPDGDPASCPDDCDFPCTVGPACPQPVQLVGGARHTCLLLDDGTVWCWGAQDVGQLGQGLEVLPSAPVRMCLPPAVRISAGNVHSCAIDQSGDVYCWGGNRYAESAPYGEMYTLSPTRLPQIENALSIESLGLVNCAHTRQDALWCWGVQLNGQGWNSQDQYQFYPAPEQSELTGVSIFGVRGFSACAQIMGELMCWGEGDEGQLGNDDFFNSETPVVAAWPSNVTLQELEGGADNMCGLGTNGDVLCWGHNLSGQCGRPPGSGEPCPDSSGNNCFSTPQPVPFDPPGQFIDLAGGWRHMCALTDMGDVFCWGHNAQHEAGAGPAAVPPQFVVGGASVMGVGRLHSCAVVGTQVLCWGSNELGQIDPQNPGGTFAMPLPIVFSP